MNHYLKHINSMDLPTTSAEELAKLILRLPSADMEFVKHQLRSKLSMSDTPSDANTVRPYNSGTNVSSLTSRENEVLTLIASGYTRRNISSALKISQNTAATHIASLYRKLDISSIAEATHVAIRNGVVHLM